MITWLSTTATRRVTAPSSAANIEPMAITCTTFASLRVGDRISDTSDGQIRSVLTVDPPRRRLVNLTTYDDDLDRIVFENDLRPDATVFLHG